MEAVPPMREQTLGQFIRANRLALGLTQEQLAARVGDNMRQSHISQLEKDFVKFPRRERLDAIAAALDVTLGDLLISTGWLEIEHAALIEQIKDDEEPDPNVLEDAMSVLSAAKEMVAETADLLVRAEGHVSSVMAAQNARNKGRAGADDDT
jgi:transcriptional regulator with XRE-family HTH domain